MAERHQKVNTRLAQLAKLMHYSTLQIYVIASLTAISLPLLRAAMERGG